MKKLIWIFSIIAYLLVALVFIGQWHRTPIGYVAYLFSAVALIVDLCLVIPQAVIRIKRLISKTKIGYRLLTVFEFKEQTVLLMSFVINVAYTFMNLINGVVNRSTWAVSFAVYYLILAILRISLFSSLNINGYGQDMKREYKRYFRCGMAMVMLCIPFGGIVTLMVSSGEGYH